MYTYRDDDIAIIGIGARFPDAEDVAGFHANLMAGRDSVGPIPAERVAATGLGMPADFLPMGYLADIHGFDHEFFGLSRREAALMDPQQRIALELAHRAVEDAGYDLAVLRQADTAVVFSSPTPAYHGMVADSGPLGMLGNLGFGTPARIAHLLGLNGPTYAIDSGCNASLIAVHHACRELRSGDAQYALTGGARVVASGARADGPGLFSEIVSPTGRCRAFDAAADGAAGGEGGAALLLTTLARARADGAAIYAVIAGSATLHSGQTAATISAPSATAQQRVIERAWRQAAVAPHTAGYLEAHGSGTRLGDAVELEGIAAVFGAGRADPLPIGSVKTNIGHLDHAAGVAGLVKAVLGLAHGRLYRSLHFERPTDALDLTAADIEVVTASRPWPAGTAPRLAGVSSFSLGGANAHCVLAEPPADTTAGDTDSPERLVRVSARSATALAELCGELAETLRGSEYPLDDVAFTLNQGRSRYEHRFAAVVRTTGELVVELAARAGRTADVRVPGPAPRVALLLAPDTVPAVQAPDPLPDALPAAGATAEVLAAQLAVHRELTRCGIEIAAVLSAGTSRYAARYLLGAPPEVTAAELAATEFTVDAVRLSAAAGSLRTAGPVVFCEPGAGGRLAALLREQSGGEIDIVSAPEPLHVLAALYERGVDIDWAAVGPRGGRRLRLPGHPLRRTRCWIDLPDIAHPVPASRPATAPAVTDPRNWLRATLRELLHTDTEIDSQDDYFELGGNSLIAVQLVDRVEEAYGFRPKLLDVYERPKVADFAELLVDGPRPASRSDIPELVVHAEPVLSFGQERMWFHHQFDPGTTLYNYPYVNRIRGHIDIDVLRGVFADLAERHESLRYNIEAPDGLPELRIRPDLGDFFRATDVSAAQDPVAAARELVRAAAGTPFDLATDPLLRVSLITLGPDDHVLQITCHHMVTDGATPVILARELPELYAARTEGRPHQLAPLPFRYRDYASWQRQLLASSALDHELDYWTRTLAGAPRLELPTDFPRPPRKGFTGDLLPFTLPAALLSDLRALARRESVSLFVALLTGLYLTLARYSGQRDIVVGTPTSGRNRRELEGMLGFFNSTVALRARLADEAPLPELLTQVRAVVLGALENQEIPFERVVNALGEHRELSRTPVFDVMYVHQEIPEIAPLADTAGSGFDTEHSPANAFGGLPAGTAKFDLTLVTYANTQGPAHDIGACVEFSTELFTRRTAEELAASYLAVLTLMVEATAPTVGTLVRAARSPDGQIGTEATGTGTPAAHSENPPETGIPTDRPRRPGGYGMDRVTGRLPAGTDGAILLAAWSSLLAWYSGRDEVSVGVVRPGRIRPEAVLIDIADEPGRTDLVARTRTVWSAEPGCRDTAVHSVWFGALPGAGTAAELALAWSPEAGDHTEFSLGYAPELFDRHTADEMAADLCRLLTAWSADPTASVFEVMS
ncbi:condensation domain-containing protein [Nocardia carnea]|uniref:condensation domain-containing protein n=1 Tax=Nocardia carnea TaxID=37328 RepID=UPI0024580CD3|nr:condensation domain-containing protein [Nocardia carnea]